MNRRNFIKSMGAAMLSIFAPHSDIGAQMQPLDELLLKMADGQKLTPLEREELRLAVLDLENVRRVAGSWISPETNTPVFRSLTVTGQPNFRKSPLHQYNFLMRTDSTVSNNTAKYITFDGTALTTYGESEIFKLNEADLTQLRVNASGQNFQISGMVTWAANATGHRQFAIEFYDINGTLGGTLTLHDFPGFSGADNVFPVSYSDSFIGFTSPLGYMKFFAFQNSGGDLTLKDVFLGIHIT